MEEDGSTILRSGSSSKKLMRRNALFLSLGVIFVLVIMGAFLSMLFAPNLSVKIDTDLPHASPGRDFKNNGEGHANDNANNGEGHHEEQQQQQQQQDSEAQQDSEGTELAEENASDDSDQRLSADPNIVQVVSDANSVVRPVDVVIFDAAPCSVYYLPTIAAEGKRVLLISKTHRVTIRNPDSYNGVYEIVLNGGENAEVIYTVVGGWMVISTTGHIVSLSDESIIRVLVASDAGDYVAEIDTDGTVVQTPSRTSELHNGVVHEDDYGVFAVLAGTANANVSYFDATSSPLGYLRTDEAPASRLCCVRDTAEGVIATAVAEDGSSLFLSVKPRSGVTVLASSSGSDGEFDADVCAKTILTASVPSTEELESGTFSHSVRVWDAQNMTFLRTLDISARTQHGCDLPSSIRFLRDKERAYISCAASGTVIAVWKDQGKWFNKEVVYAGKDSGATHLSISRDGKFMYLSLRALGEVRQYDIRKFLQPVLKATVELQGPLGPHRTAVSDDGERLYVTNSAGFAWDSVFYPNSTESDARIWRVLTNTVSGVSSGRMAVDDTFSVVLEGRAGQIILS